MRCPPRSIRPRRPSSAPRRRPGGDRAAIDRADPRRRSGTCGDDDRVSTRLFSIVVDALDHVAQARWWADALGTTVAGEEDTVAWLFLDRGLAIEVVPVPEPKTIKNRLHLDLATYSQEEHTDLVQRLLSIGATHIDVGQPDGCDWVVLADPEGNELCVLEPRPDHRYDGPLAVICLDTADVARTATFWSQAIGLVARVRRRDVGGPPRSSGGGPYLSLGGEHEPKVGKNRLHLDVAPPPDGDRDTEVDRLLASGATRLDIGQGDVDWVVLADPVGNELCVLTPR